VGAWVISLSGTLLSHTVFEPQSHGFLISLIEPEFQETITVDRLSLLDASLALELRMLQDDPYVWFSLYVIPSEPGEVLVFACNINERKRTRDLHQQTQGMLDLAFAYSNVRLWSFEDTHRPESAILTINADFPCEIDMDWSPLEHNGTAESQGDVKHTFRQSLDENAPFEIEVPFFFDNVDWLLLRGLPS
jgi:hypothetical protein